MSGRIETFPSKSANQYRSRDIFSYLGLRYCINSDLPKSNIWASVNAIQIVMGSQRGSYIKSYHYKGRKDDGSVDYRVLHLPGPSEALAEAVLISECAKYWPEYRSDRVFSYEPTGNENGQSYFQPYMEGLRKRQEEIGLACTEYPGGVVAYVDIQKFYPSITPSMARLAWKNFCDSTNISQSSRDLGFKLIYNHSMTSDGKSILTGPMFSHLIANLVFRETDQRESQIGIRYLRYVDDITLVGDRSEVLSAISRIREDLSRNGLRLHDMDSEKTIVVECAEWVESVNDFKQGYIATSWMKLVGDIKKLLIFNAEIRHDLADRLSVNGYRIPIPDYAVAVQEASAFKKVRELGIWGWLLIKTKRVSIESILRGAEELASHISRETLDILTSGVPSTVFQRKRVVSKLKYRLGRLIYIGKSRDLTAILNLLADWPELDFHAAIIESILTGNCDEVVKMGTNVSQAAAQIFRASRETAKFNDPLSAEPEIQGLAVFILNGVSVEGAVRNLEAPILRFAKGPVDLDLMSQPRGLLQEISCLHGLGEARHAEVIGTAFDLDQDIALDALEFDYGYYL